MKPRFALRTLFILIAIVGAFCAYHVSWIKKRHELLAEYSALGDDSSIYVRGTIAAAQVLPRQTLVSKRNLLWLFGEQYYHIVKIIRECKSVSPDIDRYSEQEKQLNDYLQRIADQEIATAEKYFPESQIVLEVRSLPPTKK
jgi:hypothetical protein